MSIRVAIAGVGNCASSLVQGVEYYKDTKDEDKIPGLMHNNFGGYRVRDIEFVTAFDVDALKVGKDLSEAIGASQNNTIKFADVPNLGVEVLRGPTNDGLGEYYRQMIEESDAEPVDVAQVLRDKKVDVLVSYLPVGSEKADKAYAQAALDPNGRKDVIRTVHELNKKEGITVLLITHYMEEAIDADRVIVMDDGKVIMDGIPKEIFSRVKELKEHGLDVPQATELAFELKEAGMPLTEGILSRQELVEQLTALLSDEK